MKHLLNIWIQQCFYIDMNFQEIFENRNIPFIYFLSSCALQSSWSYCGWNFQVGLENYKRFKSVYNKIFKINFDCKFLKPVISSKLNRRSRRLRQRLRVISLLCWGLTATWQVTTAQGSNSRSVKKAHLRKITPVAQKIADQRWRIANSAKNKYLFYINYVIKGWLVWINIVFSIQSHSFE